MNLSINLLLNHLERLKGQRSSGSEVFSVLVSDTEAMDRLCPSAIIHALRPSPSDKKGPCGRKHFARLPFVRTPCENDFRN